MAISRILKAKQRFYLRRSGFRTPTRWCSSTTSNGESVKSSQWKKAGAVSEQRAIAVESYVKKYMEMHSGIFPKASHVQKGVGGSWYTVKDILQNLKEKMMGSPQIPNHPSGDTSSCIVDATSFEVARAYDNLDNTQVTNPESLVESSKAAVGSHSKEKNTSHATCSIIGECSSGNMFNNAPSEVIAMHESPDSAELPEAACIDTLSEPGANSHSNKNILSKGADPHVMGEKQLTVSSISPTVASEVGEKSASFDDAQKVTGFADLFRQTMNDQVAGGMTETKSSIQTPNKFSENSNETTGDVVTKSFDIKGLIDFIKELPREQLLVRRQEKLLSEKIDQISNGGPIKEVQSEANLQQCDSKGRQTSEKREKKPGLENLFKILCTNDKVEDRERDDADFIASDGINSKPSPLSMNKTDLNKTRTAFSTEKVLHQNTVIVRFLNITTEESDVVEAFKNCGDIMRIEFSYVKPSLYKLAYIYFKTREGLLKALEKTDLMVKHEHVIVEAASSLDNTSNRISIPDLIGDPDAPAALVKNPMRTVMIKHLTPDICSHHIEEALAFCESHISGFFLGSSSSVAYVEFETEDGKERALAKHSIVVLGKRLSIFRIDMPRTTVVRISYIHFPEAVKKIHSICRSCGEVRSSNLRARDLLDVHFSPVEWPNMLKILNRLNGMKVDGHRLMAQPATAFPPEIIRVLWSHPDERRHVKAVMHNLLQKIGENAVRKAGLTDLAAKFYGDEFCELS